MTQAIAIERCAYAGCNRPIQQQPGGHRRRRYCDDNCKQAAYRGRQEAKYQQEVRERWAGFSEPTQNYLEWLLTRRDFGDQFVDGVAKVIRSEVEHQWRFDEFRDERYQQQAQQLMESGKRLKYCMLLLKGYKELFPELLSETDLYDIQGDRSHWETAAYSFSLEGQLIALVHAHLIENHQQIAAEPGKALGLMPLQAYLHVHIGARIPLRRGRKTLSISFIKDDATACAEEEESKGISLSGDEVEQMLQWVANKTGTTPLLLQTHESSEDQSLRQRIQRLEAEREAWIAWKEAEVRGAGDVSAIRQYLQEHEEVKIPVKRNGVIVRIWALGNDGVAMTEEHGSIRLSDEELQQGRVWAAKKLGQPIIGTWQPIGGSKSSNLEELEQAREDLRLLRKAQARDAEQIHTLSRQSSNLDQHLGSAKEHIQRLERELEQAQRGTEQIQERLRQYVGMTNERLSTLCGENAQLRKLQEHRTFTGEIPSGLAERLLAAGDRLHYCRLLLPSIPAGAEAWLSFAQQASPDQLNEALEAAERYYANLLHLDELELLARQSARDKKAS